MPAPHRRPRRRPPHRALRGLSCRLLCLRPSSALVVLFVRLKALLETSFLQQDWIDLPSGTQVAGQDSRKVGGGRIRHVCEDKKGTRASSLFHRCKRTY